MEARRYQLVDVFSIRNLDGGIIIFPPGDAQVRPSSRGCTISVGSHEPIYAHLSEIERLVATGVAVPN